MSSARKRRPLLAEDESTRDLWPSFTDITSTIALILFVLVLLAFVRTLIAGKKLDAFQRQITLSEQKLALLGAEIEAGQRRLKLSEEKLDEQQRALARSSSDLSDLRAKLQSIAVLRVEVLAKVKHSLETELGAIRPTAPAVTIGENGNIVINESLLFEYNSFAIRGEGKPVLQSLAKALGTLLADQSVRQNIDTIVIQGHTDERGPASFNRELSSKRANAVLDFLFESNRILEEQYGSHFAASAFSEFRPLNPAKTEVAYEQNRRIEIAVVVKDATVQRIIGEYLGQGQAGPGRP